MAHHTSIYGLSALLILAIGTAPCESVDCSLQSISDCRKTNNNDCPYYAQEVKCYEQIDASTCSDQDKEHLTAYMAWSRRGAKECPGLEEGICYFNVLRPYTQDIPYDVINPVYLSEDAQKAKCTAFKGQADDRIQKVNALKSKCNTPGMIEEIDEDIVSIKNVKKACAKFD